MTRLLSYVDAIREAHAESMIHDPNVYVIGLGVPGPTGIFGSTKGLATQFGTSRVLDMPASENAMTGAALGTALVGMRPVMVHMRLDFAVLAMEPLVNQIAKWHYMYGGRMTAPLTVRMIVGRGWGQGPQHSQSLQAWFAHIPGLRVIMPTTPGDVKGMLLAAIADDAPVIVIEHRWLYAIKGEVPEGYYTRPLSGAAIVRPGRDLTIAATSYMTLEALRAAELLAPLGIEAEVIDLRSLTPIDGDTLAESVGRTGHLIATDTGHSDFGVAAEVAAVATERAFSALKAAPVRIGLPFLPTPTSPALADLYYPRATLIAQRALGMLGSSATIPDEALGQMPWHDVPDKHFTGPY